MANGEKREGVGDGVVAVKGLLVVSYLPSKELLSIAFPEIFKQKNIGRRDIRMVVGYFRNKLGSLSRKFYRELNRMAVKIPVGQGRYIYIMPEENVSRFADFLESIRDEYREYEEDLRAFLLRGVISDRIKRKISRRRAKVDLEYLAVVKEYVRQLAKTVGDRSDPWEDFKRRVEELSIADRVYVRMIPFSLDVGLVEEYLDEKAKRVVEREVAEFRRQLAEEIKKRLTEEAERLEEKILEVAYRGLKEELPTLEEGLDEIEDRARRFGVDVDLGRLRRLVREYKRGTLASEVARRRLEKIRDTRLRKLLEKKYKKAGVV